MAYAGIVRARLVHFTLNYRVAGAGVEGNLIAPGRGRAAAGAAAGLSATPEQPARVAAAQARVDLRRVRQGRVDSAVVELRSPGGEEVIQLPARGHVEPEEVEDAPRGSTTAGCRAGVPCRSGAQMALSNPVAHRNIIMGRRNINQSLLGTGETSPGRRKLI